MIKKILSWCLFSGCVMIFSGDQKDAKLIMKKPPRFFPKMTKEQSRAAAFAKQDPAQKDFFAKFMDSWRNHLANKHPNFDQYSPENQSKVKDNFANQYDQQLQIGQKNYDQRKLSEEIANLQNRLQAIRQDDSEIRSQEEARLKPRSPLEEERSGPLET